VELDVAVVTAAECATGLPAHEFVPVRAAHVLPFQLGPPAA
jgi:hypothetical protein